MSSEPITIGIDLSCLIPQPLTGVGYYTLHLFRALLASNAELDVRLFASSAQTPPDIVLSLGKHCSRLRAVRWPTRLKNFLWTRLEWPPIEWFTGPIDVAHGAFHLLPATQRARRMATVFDLSGLRYPDTHTTENLRHHSALLRHAVSTADALIAISQSCKADLVELLDAREDRIHVVYGGIHLEEFGDPRDSFPSSTWERVALDTLRNQYGIRGDYLIHLGTIEPRKNLPRLLEAYARVRARVRDCPCLVLAGQKGWKCDDVFETIARMKLTDKVIHTGYLPRSDAVCLLRGACACVYPSLYEGFGLPVLEAMAARIPVLTSNVSSLPEVLGDTGLLVAPEQVDAIEEGLMALLEHRDAALQRIDAAYARATQFTWAKSAESLAAVYRTVARNAGP